MIVDERELRREHGSRVQLDLLLEHEPLEHEARRDVPVADRPRERVDATDRICPAGSVHSTPAGRLSCPTVSEGSKSGPAAPGPLQSF